MVTAQPVVWEGVATEGARLVVFPTVAIDLVDRWFVVVMVVERPA